MFIYIQLLRTRYRYHIYIYPHVVLIWLQWLVFHLASINVPIAMRSKNQTYLLFFFSFICRFCCGCCCCSCSLLLVMLLLLMLILYTVAVPYGIFFVFVFVVVVASVVLYITIIIIIRWWLVHACLRTLILIEQILKVLSKNTQTILNISHISYLFIEVIEIVKLRTTCLSVETVIIRKHDK